MSKEISLEVRVSVDMGYHSHNVAIGLSSGEVLEEFQIPHRPEGFQYFFSRIESHRKEKGYPVAVAMERFNGYARPLDSLVRARGYRLYNINNLKLARFKEIFPGAAKTDPIDARKGLELFQLRDHLPLAKEVLQEVARCRRRTNILDSGLFIPPWSEGILLSPPQPWKETAPSNPEFASFPHG